METYLKVTFNSEGSSPSEVAEKLRGFGFQPTHGNYDFIYDWRREVSLEEAMDFADQMGRLLKGSKVLFEMETV